MNNIDDDHGDMALGIVAFACTMDAAATTFAVVTHGYLVHSAKHTRGLTPERPMSGKSCVETTSSRTRFDL